MRKIVLLAALAALAAFVGTGWSRADAPKDLTKLIVPDNDAAALKALKAWLDARGIACEIYNDNQVLLKRGGVLMNLHPFIAKGELDRLRVLTLYSPTDEYKGTKKFEEHVAKLNKSQNFLQVFVTDDGRLAISANLTFFDELTAHHFDGFVDFYAQVVKRWVLTEETLKMIK